MARGDFPSSKQDQYVLRFPDGMREHLKAAAKSNGRSMNAEIIDRLEHTIALEQGWEAMRQRPLPTVSGEMFHDATKGLHDQMQTERAEVKQALQEILRRIEKLEK